MKKSSFDSLESFPLDAVRLPPTKLLTAFAFIAIDCFGQTWTLPSNS